MKVLVFVKKGKLNLFAASIFLIVLMVPISVAVNVLTDSPASRALMTEDLTVSSVVFSGGNTIYMSVNNSGTLAFTVGEVWVNNEKQSFTTIPTNAQVWPNGTLDLSVNCVYFNGTCYHIKITSEREKEYFASATPLW
jgi:hypothetical protein